MEVQPVITLLSDFGTADGYIGAVKGVILSINPRAGLVDITHDVPAQDILGGALALAAAAPYFPRGTIHLAVVDPGVGSERKPIVIQHQGHYLVGPDNGLLTLAFSETPPQAVYHLTRKKRFLDSVSRTFHGRDIFAPVAAHLSRGVPPQELGEPLSSWVNIELPRPRIKESTLMGEVIHIDRFGNLITNIKEQDLPPLDGTDALTIRFEGRILEGVKQSYAQADEGELLAVIGGGGYLEISQNRGNAAMSLGMGPGTPVEVMHPKYAHGKKTGD